jgi:alpha-aminoadipic semialdehyde synthase
MLQRILDRGCQLIDYEKIVDKNGRRLVFFGHYAGLAGMIDTLWSLGQRLSWEKLDTPFDQVRQALQYNTLEEAKRAIQELGQRITREGLPKSLTPLICGFAGYGNVSRGAQEIYDLLPTREIAPAELAELLESFDEHDPHHVYKVVFKEQHMVEPTTPGATFQLQDYYDHPERYRSQFEHYLPYLTLLINGIYWTDRYPRFVTRCYLKALFTSEKRPRLRVIGDISCDVEGAVECNLRTTTPGSPIYVYDPLTGLTQDGYIGRGVVVLAVDNLPSELPRDSSTHFSTTLMPFVPEIAQADYSAPFTQCNLSATIKRAVIAWQGQLTPDFRYIQAFL